MSILTPIPRDTPWYARLFFALPVLGWMARDVAFGHPENLYYALIALVSAWMIGIMTFGVIALYLPMVVLTPVCLAMLVFISRG
ncbi:MAG: hypothetical protein CML68_07615 [Rhodobacteraceae bacterium]|nr:hypothetical protein [Paracoccaceae bacterium]